MCRAKHALLPVVALLSLSVGCTSELTAPARQVTIPRAPVFQTTLDCQSTGACEYAYQAYPGGDGPGIVLDGVGPTECNTEDHTRDTDYDGLDQQCEYRIASAFAPALQFAANEDDASRESYWAAYRANIGGYFGVTVAYLLGYHRDRGNEQFPGHLGDSEFIFLDVIWTGNSTWKLEEAYLSAHWLFRICAPWQCWSLDRSDLYKWWDFNFSGSVRGAPTIFVSKNKHANYNSNARCSVGDGGCEIGGAPVTAEVLPDRNIGSGFAQLVGSVGSVNPQLYPGTENFWQKSTFDGWHLQSDNSTPYYKVLNFFEGRRGLMPTENMGRITVDSIRGPNVITIANNYAWEALTAAGDGVNTYRWEYRWDAGPWQYGGSDKMWFEYIDPAYNPGNHWLYLRVTVTSQNESSVREFTVNTSSCGMPYCGDGPPG